MEEALGDFDRVIQLEPGNYGALFNRGAINLRLDNYIMALADYDRVIELSVDDHKAHCNRGIAQIGVGEFRRAVGEFTVAIDLNDDDPYAYYYRALAGLVLGEWNLARSDFEIATNRGVNCRLWFADRYSSVSEFEARYRVSLPSDLADILSDDPIEQSCLSEDAPRHG